MSEKQISGVVFDEMKKPVKGVAIFITKVDAPTADPSSPWETITNEKGYYQQDGLTSGKYNILAIKENYTNNIGENKSFDFDEKTGLIRNFKITSLDTIKKNNETGKSFLRSICLRLIGLVALYILLHIFIKESGPLSQESLQKVERLDTIVHQLYDSTKVLALDQTFGKAYFLFEKEALGAPVESIKTAVDQGQIKAAMQYKKLLSNAVQDTFKFKTPKGGREEAAKVLEALESIIDTVPKVEQNKDFNAILSGLSKDLDSISSSHTLYSSLIQAIEKDAEENNFAAIKKRLGELGQLVENPPGKFDPWTRYPWQYLEILFWALAGILVRKIIVCGRYLRFKSFLPEGIPMHMSHIVGIPLIVLVTMLILSLVSFSFSIDGEGAKSVVVDLSNSKILAAFSFVLAARPWAVWDFVEDSGGRLLSGFNKKDGE